MIGEMWALVGSAEFAFGLALLVCHQYSRFRELGAVDGLPEDTYRLLNLTARDFIGPWTYRIALVIYWLATAAIYLYVCAIVPIVDEHLKEVYGIQLPWAAATEVAATGADESEDGRAHVIWIAAIYMGLAVPGIPAFAYISTAQRDFFHNLVGIPRRVIVTSKNFGLELGRTIRDEAQLRAKAEWFAGEDWKATINDYADIRFYDTKLRELKLADADISKTLQGSEWQLRSLVNALVFTSAVATTRRSGGAGLSRLARDLGLPRPEYPSRVLVAAACLVLFAVSTTLLLFVVVGLGSLVGPSLIPPHDGTEGRVAFWPASMEAAVPYVQDQVLPMLLAVSVALFMLTPSVLRNLDGRPGDYHSLLVRATPMVLVVIGGVVVFDYLALITRTEWLRYNEAWQNRELLTDLFWFYMLHGAVVALACLVVAAYGRRVTDKGPPPSFRRWVWRMSLLVGGASAAFALIKLLYDFQVEPGWTTRVRAEGVGDMCYLRRDGIHCQTLVESLDYLALVVVLTLAAAIVGLVAAHVVYSRVEPVGRIAPDPVAAPA